MHENIYALAHGPEENPTFFYAGKTVQPIEARFRNHLRGMRNPLDHKQAYEYARHIGIEEVRIVFLDSTGNGLTENDYVRTLIEAGHPIQNANQGNKKVAKKRTPSLFTVINREALARTAGCHSTLLNREVQTLTKPEVEQLLVPFGIPDAAALDAMDWRPSVCALMPFKPQPKRLDEVSVEVLKSGDLHIFLAFKTGKWAYWVKNTRTTLADSYKVNWRSARKGFTRRDGLEQIVAEFPRFTWWRLPAAHPWTADSRATNQDLPPASR